MFQHAGEIAILDLVAKQEDMEKQLREAKAEAQGMKLFRRAGKRELLDLKAKQEQMEKELSQEREARQRLYITVQVGEIQITDLKNQHSATNDELDEQRRTVEQLKFELEEVKQNMGHEIDEERAAKDMLQAVVDNLQEKSQKVVDFLLHCKEPGSLKRSGSEDNEESETKHRRSKGRNVDMKKTPQYLFRTAARKAGMLRAILVYGESLLTYSSAQQLISLRARYCDRLEYLGGLGVRHIIVVQLEFWEGTLYKYIV
jgi:chromosome segregation ATPase